MKNFKIVQNMSLRLAMVFVMAVFMVAVHGCSDAEEAGSETRRAQGNIPAVEAVEARFGSLPLSERLSGTVIAENQVALYPEISGRISEVLVQNGSRVERGTPLVRIDDRQFREQVQQAEAGLRISRAQQKQAQASLAELESEYKRVLKLSEQNLSSDLELERLQARMESARADVDLASARVEQAESTLQERKDLLARTVVRSPINGTVGQRNAEIGMQVNTGTRLFTVGDLSNLRVEVILTEGMLNRITVGQTARIYVGEGTDEASATTSRKESGFITAQLSRISPFLNTVTRSTEAEIDVKNIDDRLRPGMFVAVDILYGESEQATLIPTSALYTNPNNGEEGVFVATSLGSEIEVVVDSEAEGTGSGSGGGATTLTQPVDVQFRPINVIAEGRMEMGVSGIEPGSWIVTVGQDLLSQGRNQARVRTSSWDRILTLQSLQRQDLLERVLNRIDTSQSTL